MAPRIMLLHKGGNGGGIENGRGIKHEIVNGNGSGNGDGNGIGNGIGKSVSEESVSENSVSADFAIGTHRCLRKISIGRFRSRKIGIGRFGMGRFRYRNKSVSEPFSIGLIRHRKNSGKHRYQK